MRYKIIVETEALKDLEDIIDFISERGDPNRAYTFAGELKDRIASLETMPIRCRKSIYTDTKDTRDMIYKGYTIVFQIREDQIHILTIFRQKSFV